MGKIYLSREGHEKLRKELEYLQRTKRKEITRDIGHARSLGDLKENAEYHAAKEAQGLNEKKIYELENKLSSAELIEELNISSEEIRIGAKARLLDHDAQEECEYTLVSSEESNPQEGLISVNAPIGRALLGHRVGDVLEIKIPAGTLKYEVLQISR
ncbi:MAG: transcription elongation factor GreA [Candidatus Saelkia tenebricola]|nr:transcription elongation factor GreA [Candidatus Saelkia tenebricola]